MAAAPSRKPRPNPFYVLLMVVSTLFVVTALGYLVGPYVEIRAKSNPLAASNTASRALAGWFDRKGVWALMIEFGIMLVLGVLAMATDRHFQPPSPPKPPGPDPS